MDSNATYTSINSVTLYNEDGKCTFDHITDFAEYDDDIVIESATKIVGLERGWVGDLFYHAKGFMVTDDTKNVNSTACITDVLLARITASAQPGSPVVWRYTFLKH